ncbi:MAG: hypothetical protein JWN06_353 [Propionibacteriaceae bacterium]|nr:hypothetical protein [Propionibacteriaceae bacterium]
MSGSQPPNGGSDPHGVVGPKKSSSKTLLLGAAVLALLVLVVGGGLLLNRSGSASGLTDPGVPADPGSLQPGRAGNPSDAVRRYLEALAAGQARAALAAGEDQPGDRSFLTDAVLKDSNSRAPITEIDVPGVTDQNTYSVQASYKIGDQPVTESFSVNRVGGNWKLTKPFAELNIDYARRKTLPMRLNGVPVKNDRVRLFPGSYAFTTGSKYVDYGSDNVLLLKTSSEYPIAKGVKPSLTETGSKAFLKSARAGISKCLDQQKLVPSGCPFGIRLLPGQKIDESTISWKLAESPWDHVVVGLDAEKPALARAAVQMRFEFFGRGMESGKNASFGPHLVYRSVEMQAIMTKKSVEVTLS